MIFTAEVLRTQRKTNSPQSRKGRKGNHYYKNTDPALKKHIRYIPYPLST